MKRMKTNPNILTEPPSPTTSPTKLKHQSSRYWNENPEASSVDSLYLEEKTKAAIGELYNLIDTNGDGELTIEDFQKPTSAMSRDAIVKWELLCARPGPTAPHTSLCDVLVRDRTGAPSSTSTTTASSTQTSSSTASSAWRSRRLSTPPASRASLAAIASACSGSTPAPTTPSSKPARKSTPALECA